VEEHEIDCEVLVADLNRVLASDEAEVASELGDEATEVAQQRAVKIGLGVAFPQVQKLEAVCVLEFLHGGRVHLCHRR
jgi:hypothetical protein